VKVLFIEPPKTIWFVMGEYLPPPYGIIQLAAYLERAVPDVAVEVVDCTAEALDWRGLELRIRAAAPDVVASSGLSTCNTYLVLRTLEIAKAVDPAILTVTGGQHFTATAQESLAAYPELDVIVRGEGEQTLTELVQRTRDAAGYTAVRGTSYRTDDGGIRHNPPRPLLANLDDLPYPGYHLVEPLMGRYHFTAMMGPRAPYALIEGSRGCQHRCTFCSQWCHWQGTWRSKTPARVADELLYCYERFGSRFIWLTDDNFAFGHRGTALADALVRRGVPDDLMWFTQARCDDVVRHRSTLPQLRRAGLRWVLLGVERDDPSTLTAFRKQIAPADAVEAVRLLKAHDIFAQAMFILGTRQDTTASIAALRDFAHALDPDFAIFALLTPFPGTQLYADAERQGWIEDRNWSHYDMIHAIMPTETLSRRAVQDELYRCYRHFYGSWNRRIAGLVSRNALKRRIYWYMLGRGIIQQLRAMAQAPP
jgi:anaerobic magnesium-protoporphyrin IX monomethyl ester cyclase